MCLYIHDIGIKSQRVAQTTAKKEEKPNLNDTKCSICH